VHVRLAPKKLIPLVVAALVLVVLGHDAQRPIGGPGVAVAQNGRNLAPAPINHGYVIVLRGLMNIWSRGMDTVAKELEARGARVHLDNHRHWKELAAEVAKKYESDRSIAPVIIVGHSLGANAAVLMAEKLGQYRVPVRLIVAFDGLAHTEDTQAIVSWNVQEVLNFYNGSMLGMEMVPGRGFGGTIDNVNVQGVRGAGHIRLDKNPELQARAISLVMQVLAETSAQSASN
jgi:pimeloyl-ACP methyl ester carboxylesterase